LRNTDCMTTALNWTATKTRGLALVIAGTLIGSAVTAGIAYSLTPTYEKLPACAHEDGNPDGNPCWWTDPDTGTRYYVTSENYR